MPSNDGIGNSEKIDPNSAQGRQLVGRLTTEQVQLAADMLLSARNDGAKFPQLPDEVTPQNTTDIQRIIDSVSARIDRAARGWKIYTVYRNQDPPFWCPVYDVFPSGAELPVDFAPDRLLEPEIMFRAERDFPARDRNYGVTEILESVTAHVAFEILAPRFHGLTIGERPVYASLADHISNGGVVIGDKIPDWQTVDFEDVTLRVTDDDVEVFSVVGGHPFDNPFLPIVVLVNRVRRQADIKAGDILVSASSASFFTGGIGTTIRASYEGVGDVAMTFVP
jgi:2-keto-4-pentenoate hydratase